MTSASQCAIDQNFASIRSVIETKVYDDLGALLAEQRTLISNLSFADPEARAYIIQAQNLVAWSLTIVQLERSALEQTLSDVARLKQLEEYQRGSRALQSL